MAMLDSSHINEPVKTVYSYLRGGEMECTIFDIDFKVYRETAPLYVMGASPYLPQFEKSRRWITGSFIAPSVGVSIEPDKAYEIGAVMSDDSRILIKNIQITEYEDRGMGYGRYHFTSNSPKQIAKKAKQYQENRSAAIELLVKGYDDIE